MPKTGNTMEKLSLLIIACLLQLSLSAQNCLDVTLSTNDATCYSDEDGTIKIIINNGNGPFTYNWGASSHISGSTYNINNLPADIYPLNISDANGCSYMSNVSVGQPDSLKQSVSGFLCGSGCWCITSEVMGGTPPYSYEWSNGDTLQTVVYCDSSTYTITVTDSLGCEVTGSTSIAIVAVPFGISTFNISPIVCGGECTGGVSMQLFGGIPPYTYNWSNGATTKDVFGLCSGETFVTVVDATLHAITKSFQIPENTPISVDNIDIDYINDCNLSCDGTMEAIATGGFAPYTYFWNGDNGFSASTNAVTDICEGNYTLSIIDSLGCLFTRDFAMLCASEALNVNGDVIHPSCESCCDGFIQINPLGGFPPYDFDWSDTPFNIDNVRNDMCEGTYTCTVTDANDQTFEYTAVLQGPTAIENIVVSDIKVSPNPVSTSCAIELSLKEQSNITAVLADINGKQIATILSNTPIQAGEFRKEIGLENYPSGLYFLSIRSSDGISTVQKIIKM